MEGNVNDLRESLGLSFQTARFWLFQKWPSNLQRPGLVFLSARMLRADPVRICVPRFLSEHQPSIGPAGFQIPSCLQNEFGRRESCLPSTLPVSEKGTHPARTYHTGVWESPEGNRDLQWGFKAIGFARHVFREYTLYCNSGKEHITSISKQTQMWNETEVKNSQEF